MIWNIFKRKIHGSDHFPLIFQMKFDNMGYRKLSNRINNYKTDWIRYRTGIKYIDNKLVSEMYTRGNVV